VCSKKMFWPKKMLADKSFGEIMFLAENKMWFEKMGALTIFEHEFNVNPNNINHYHTYLPKQYHYFIYTS
jgi:hypothetical protein